MSSAGKKLQDIFDAGSSRLSELEQTQLSVLTEKASEHQAEVENFHDSSTEQTEQRADELQNSITDHMTKSVQRIQKSIEAETQETDKHLKLLLEKVANLGQKLQDSINELRESHEFKVNSLC